jgi:chitinase
MWDRDTARVRKYGVSETTRIMMATVLTSLIALELRKFQAKAFVRHCVQIIKTHGLNSLDITLFQNSVLKPTNVRAHCTPISTSSAMPGFFKLSHRKIHVSKILSLKPSSPYCQRTYLQLQPMHSYTFLLLELCIYLPYTYLGYFHIRV